jgi:AraC family ethanolamine operon transcriptional activator
MNLEHSHLLERSALGGTYALESVKWAQLEPGRFAVRYGVLDAGPVQLATRHVSVGFKIQADVLPNKFMLGVVADSHTHARWFGAHVDKGSIFATDSSIDVSTQGPSWFHRITIDEPSLAVDFPNAPDVLALMEGVRSVTLARDRVHAARVRAFVQRLFAIGNDLRTTLLPRVLPQKLIYGTLVPLLAAAIGGFGSHAIHPSRCTSRRLAAVRACEAFMREHVDATVTLLDLSEASGMRSRSLINAFEAVTGYSPMDYLKRLRLNGVHGALQGADKTQSRIIDVATDWGFWHMGHFANDYRLMFGETPSQTLLRS